MDRAERSRPVLRALPSEPAAPGCSARSLLRGRQELFHQSLSRRTCCERHESSHCKSFGSGRPRKHLKMLSLPHNQRQSAGAIRRQRIRNQQEGCLQRLAAGDHFENCLAVTLQFVLLIQAADQSAAVRVTGEGKRQQNRLSGPEPPLRASEIAGVRNHGSRTVN